MRSCLRLREQREEKRVDPRPVRAEPFAAFRAAHTSRELGVMTEQQKQE